MASLPAAARRQAVNLLDPTHQAGLQSLLSRVYAKPVELNIIPLKRPHLDADILASVVTQRLRDRRVTPRRGIRDAAWKAHLPNDRTVTELQQAKQQPPISLSSRTVETGSAFAKYRTESSEILKSLNLSQVSSVMVGAAGRLSKRLTANRAQRKVARRGANTKGPGYMLRGFRKSHIAVASKSGKRRIGSYGVHVALGHT